MTYYWILFAYFAIGALLSRNWHNRGQSSSLALVAGSAFIAILVGFRFEVGADWKTYQFLFSYARIADLGRILEIGDPGYQFLNWAAQRTSGEFWLVNLICGLIFAWGLHRFATVQPDPWLAFVIAVPYLVVVVAMGYSRQAVAIGVLMAGLASMSRGGSVLRFAGYVAVAALFHKTAVVVLPLVIFAGQRSKLLNIVAGIAGSVALYDVFLSSSVEGFVRNYIETEYSSQGAAIRVLMNLVPAFLYMIFRRRMHFAPVEMKLWLYFSVAAFVLPLMLLFLPSSTVVDRLALYLIPMQVAILPRLEYVFQGQTFGKILIVAYSSLVMFTWLNFATHAEYWLPYRFDPELFG